MSKKNNDTDYTNVVLDESQQFKSKVEETKKEPTPKRMVSKPVKVKKEGLVERLVKGVIGPDGLPKVGRYLNQNVIMPSIRDIIVKSVQDGVSMMVYRQDMHRGPQSGGYSQNQGTDYGRQYRQHGYGQSGHQTKPQRNYAREYKEPGQQQVLRDGVYLNQYMVANRDEAQSILNGLQEYILDYGQATVASYYQMLGIDTVFTDDSFGWDDLRGVRVLPYNGSFVIDLPPVRTLN